MQTFLPYPSFSESSQVLRTPDLGTQRTENFLILRAIFEDRDWSSRHPVVDQWRGYEWLLMQYQLAICAEWVSRGREDKTLRKTQRLYQMHCPPISPGLPEWLGDESYHQEQQERLLNRNRKHYSRYFV